MTIPFVFGWPQVFLLIIAIVGILLLVNAFVGLRRRRYRDEEYEHKFENRRYHGPLRFRPRWGRLLGGLLLVFFAISLLWLSLLIQTYLGLTSDIEVARIHATPVANVPHLMSVDLTLFDQNGHQVSEQTYIINGDEWILEGDIIKFPPWLNIFGLHSGYKLTRLEGRFDDPTLEANSHHTVVVLNGGDDNFFKTVQEQAWTSPFVQAAYGSGTFIKPDGKTYDVFVSQTGLYAAPEK
jgi:hypothetical protein